VNSVLEMFIYGARSSAACSGGAALPYLFLIENACMKIQYMNGNLCLNHNISEGKHCYRGCCHTFRHSFAAHLIKGGYDIRTVQELPGQYDVRTTDLYACIK